MQLIALDDVRQARLRQRDTVLTTPLLPSASFSRLVDREVWLKAENLQRTGSFKIRGATNVIAQLDAEQRRLGVVAGSAGNHAQGVALAAQLAGVPATVFMPETAALPKVEATRSYGADVRLSGPNIQAAVELALAFSHDTGARFVHPFDDRQIIEGQGTLGLEIAEQLPDAAVVVIPVGGGGLISGSAVALKALRPEIRLVGVEIESVAPYIESRRAGEPTSVAFQATVADGIAVPVPSPLAFAHIEAFVDDLVAVDDTEATRAVAMLLERAKLLVEGAGAVGVAALLEGRIPAGPGPTVVVLSGGNIDMLLVGWLIRHGLEAAGRFGWYRVRIPDRPGHLAGALQIIADLGGNVLTVDHGREGLGLPFRVTELRISVETTGPEHGEAIRRALEGYESHLGISMGSSAREGTDG